MERYQRRRILGGGRAVGQATRETSMYISIPLEEVQSLLHSAELAEVQEAVLRKIGSRLVPEAFATPFQRDLSYAGIPVGAIYDLFRHERDLVIRFAILCQSAPEDPAEADGEFPPGEEPGPNDRSTTIEALGHGNGFLIHHAIALLLARRGKVELLSFLKWRRIPSAARYCKELLQHVKTAAEHQ